MKQHGIQGDEEFRVGFHAVLERSVLFALGPIKRSGPTTTPLHLHKINLFDVLLMSDYKVSF